MAEGIAALMLRPAIENFVKNHRQMIVKLDLRGPNVRMALYDFGEEKEFTSAEFTPAQQVSIVTELFKIVGGKP